MMLVAKVLIMYSPNTISSEIINLLRKKNKNRASFIDLLLFEPRFN